MRLGYLTPLSFDTIAAAKRLGYDAIEVAVRWVDQPTLGELERDLPALRDRDTSGGGCRAL